MMRVMMVAVMRKMILMMMVMIAVGTCKKTFCLP